MRVISKFRLLNRFNIGMLLILACSIFIIIISIFQTNNGIDLAIGLSIGIVALIVSLAAVLKQFTDFLFVTDKEIVFRNSLRKKTFQITPDLKVKTVTERKYINVTRIGGSRSREVEVFIKKDKIKHRIFNFSMEDEYSKEVAYLKKTIARFIKRKIRDTVVDKC